MGKTAFLINIIMNSLMKKTESNGQFYSLEQPEEQILMRVVSSLGNVDLTRMKSGMMDQEDWARVSGVFKLLTEDIKDRLLIDGTSGLTPAMLRVRDVLPDVTATLPSLASTTCSSCAVRIRKTAPRKLPRYHAPSKHLRKRWPARLLHFPS
jgi:hypothetical protein